MSPRPVACRVPVPVEASAAPAVAPTPITSQDAALNRLIAALKAQGPQDTACPATAPLRARYRVSADGALAEYDTAADTYRPLASAP